MLIEINRPDTATYGLIAIRTDQTANFSFQLYKPTELQNLNIKDLNDGVVSISFLIGQDNYEIETNGVDVLNINGADQAGQTSEQIRDTFSQLFLESTGGGGGTTDNTTPPYLPFKSAALTFEDSVIQHDIEPAGNDFKLTAGKLEVSSTMENDDVNGVKRIQWGNVLPVVSPYDNIFIELDFIADLYRIICKNINIGDEDTSTAVIKLRADNFLTELGDVNNNNAGSKIVIDDNDGIIKIHPNDGNDYRINIDAGNGNIEIKASNQFVKITQEMVNMGDIDALGNSVTLQVNDTDKQIVGNVDGCGFKQNGNGALRQTEIGDHTGTQNGNLITVDDINEKVSIVSETIEIANKTNGSFTNFRNLTGGADTLINIEKLPNYISNAAALLAGRAIGDLYYLTGDGMVRVVI